MKWLWFSALVIALDVWTKSLASSALELHVPIRISNNFNLTLMHNSGAAFSFLNQAGGWQRWLFVVLAVGICILLIVWLRRIPKGRHWLPCALALIIGGALGNLWDRLVQGYVIDFIQLHYQQWFWPAFNIADSAITIGALMLILESLWQRHNPA